MKKNIVLHNNGGCLIKWRALGIERAGNESLIGLNHPASRHALRANCPVICPFTYKHSAASHAPQPGVLGAQITRQRQTQRQHITINQQHKTANDKSNRNINIGLCSRYQLYKPHRLFISLTDIYATVMVFYIIN